MAPLVSLAIAVWLCGAAVPSPPLLDELVAAAATLCTSFGSSGAGLFVSVAAGPSFFPHATSARSVRTRIDRFISERLLM